MYTHIYIYIYIYIIVPSGSGAPTAYTQLRVTITVTNMLKNKANMRNVYKLKPCRGKIMRFTRSFQTDRLANRDAYLETSYG